MFPFQQDPLLIRLMLLIQKKKLRETLGRPSNVTLFLRTFM